MGEEIEESLSSDIEEKEFPDAVVSHLIGRRVLSPCV
jgi:hypothetical protein